jgi:hypothetical protein
MKKSVFILVVVLMSVFSYTQAQDTIRLDTDSYPADTINMAYILPEVVDSCNCLDEGHYDPLFELVYRHDKELSLMVCDTVYPKSVAQGFMLNEQTAIEGICGQITLYLPYGFSNDTGAEFKLGIMDENLNVIYQKDYYLKNGDNYDYSQMFDNSLLHLPLDSTLYLNGFVYIFMEWPDTATTGGIANSILRPNLAKAQLYAFSEEDVFFLTDTSDLTRLYACEVKYEPLFNWPGENTWIPLKTNRCDFYSETYSYGILSMELIPNKSCPPVGLGFYSSDFNSDNNNEDNDDGGDDSGLSDLNISHLVSLSPNPAKDIVTVQSSFKVREIEIHNALGQVVLRKQGSQNIETIDVSNLQSGTYIVRIKTQRGFANKKIVIE